MALYMEDSFDYLGTNTITVDIWGRGTSRNATVDDLYAIVKKYPDYLESITPLVSTSGTLRIGTTDYYSTTKRGVSEDYLKIKDYTLAEGRGLQYMDMVDRKQVCVIGNYLAQNAFGGDALGKTLKIGKEKFTVVGVLTQQSSQMTEYGADNCLFVPYSTAARLWNGGNVEEYVITVTDKDKSYAATELIEQELYKIYEDDYAYYVTNATEILDTMNSMINVVITILAVIASISLVVGGIGIMNIMLVSVTERTREIGIRKALGAKESAILQQFVMEAATTSALGGVMGILIGYLLSLLATKATGLFLDTELRVVPSTSAILAAFGISVGIGVLFGYLPARKAAHLNPIDALRYD
jgi:putative ABC transport system permease protein